MSKYAVYSPTHVSYIRYTLASLNATNNFCVHDAS